jgi:hypothetical protein
MYYDDDVFDIIRKLNASSKYGEVEKLSDIFFTLYKKNIISVSELEIMLASNQAKRWTVEGRMNLSALSLALGKSIIEELNQEKTVDSDTINYLQ